MRAVDALNDQRLLRRIITILGPLTTRELHRHCERYLPGCSLDSLRRRVYRLQQAGAVIRMPVQGSGEVFWGATGATLPTDAKTRTKPTLPKTIVQQRRHAFPTSGTGQSWWTIAQPDNFSLACRKRFES